MLLCVEAKDKTAAQLTMKSTMDLNKRQATAFPRAAEWAQSAVIVK